MKTLKTLLLAAVLLLFAGLAQGVEYTNAPPLTQVVRTSVGEVSSGPTQVPLITWGGDIATIYANGNSRQTVKESIFGEQGLNLNLVREDDFKKQVENYLSGKSPYLRGTTRRILQGIKAVFFF